MKPPRDYQSGLDIMKYHHPVCRPAEMAHAGKCRFRSTDQPVVGPGDGPFRRTFQRESPSCSTSWRSEAHGVAWNAMNSVKLEVNRIDGSALKLFFTPYCQTLPDWFILEFFMLMNVSMKPSKLRQSSFCIKTALTEKAHPFKQIIGILGLLDTSWLLRRCLMVAHDLNKGNMGSRCANRQRSDQKDSSY